MQKINAVHSSLSPSSSDTDSLHAPSAADSPAIPLAKPSFPSPANTYVEPQRDGVHAAHIQGTAASPEEGRFSVSSSSDEEMVRQHACDILADSSHDDATHGQQAWNASPIQHGKAVDGGLQRGDVNPGPGSNDANTSQLSVDMYADVEKGWGFVNVKQMNGEEERCSEYCRVCHLSVEKSPSSGGEFIKLGCACKDDLALAHRLCAETWFKIKGNRTCEICGSTAQNISGNGDVNLIEQWTAGELNNPVPIRSERCWQNQPVCNTVLVCVILVLIASWLFRVTLF